MNLSSKYQELKAYFKKADTSAVYFIIYLTASAFLLGVFFFFAYFSHLEFEGAVIAQNQDNLSAIANTTSRSIDNFFEQHTKILDTVASNQVFQDNMNKLYLPSANEYQKNMVRSVYVAHQDDEAEIYLLDASGGFVFRYPETDKKEYHFAEDMTDRPGVSQVLETKQPYVSELFESNEGEQVVSILVPVLKGEELVGILRWLETDDKVIQQSVSSVRTGETSYVWLIENNGLILSHPDSELEGKDISQFHSTLTEGYDWTDLTDLLAVFGEGEEGFSRYHNDGDIAVADHQDGGQKLTAYSPVDIGGLAWTVGASLDYSEVVAPINKNLTKTLYFVFFETLLIVAGGYFIFRINLNYIRRKESEKAAIAIKEQDDKYQELFESSPGIIVVLGLDGVIMDMNKDFAQLGYSRNELLGKHFSDADIFSRSNLKEYTKLFSLIAKGVDVGNFEIEIQAKTGGVRDVEVFSSILKKEDKVYAIQFVARDITERRNTEKALKESQQMLEMVMGTIPQYIFWKDMDLEFIGCNENFARLVGLQSPDEIIGKNDFDIALTKEAAKFFREEDSRVIEQNKPSLHLVREETGVDGTVRWLDINRVPLVDSRGEIVGVLGYFEDITERMLAEEALKESEKNLKKAQQIAHVGSWEWDLQDNSFILSEEACAIYGLNPKDHRITSFQTLVEKTIHPEDKAVVEEAAEKVAKGSKGESIHYRIVRPNGEIRWVSAMSPEVRSLDSDGKPRVVIGTVQDITNLRMAELALRESEIRFRELFKNMSSGVAIYKVKGEGEEFIFSEVNAAVEKIEQLQKSEILGKKVEDVFPAVISSGLMDVFRRVWRTGKPELFPMYFYKDDRIEGWRKNYVYKLPTGEIVSVYDDLTEQKVAEEKVVDLYKHLAFINRRVSILSDIHTHDYSFSEEQTVNLIVTTARSIAQAEVCLLYRISEEDSGAKLLASDGDISEQQKNHIEDLSPGSLVFLQKIVETNMRVQGKVDEHDFDKLMISKGIKSFIALPLIVEDDLKGFLMLGFSGDREITTQDLDFYSVFVTRIASFL